MDMQFLQDNWMLVSLAVVSGAMLAWSFIGGRLSGVEQADTLKATRLYNDDALVLDVREDKEYAAGHIPKAKHIPLGQLAGRLNELDKYKSKPDPRHLPQRPAFGACLRHAEKGRFRDRVQPGRRHHRVGTRQPARHPEIRTLS
jgi:hypothetical protein